VTNDITVGIQVVGNYAYLANGFQGLRIVDIHNPQNPMVMGSYAMPTAVKDVFVVYPYAYMADQEYGLYILSISDPAHPSLTGHYDTPGQAQGIYVSGNYAYVADSDNLQILDISDPANPVFAGSYYLSGGPSIIYIQGNYAYCDDINRGVNILDISNPANPVWMGRCEVADSPTDMQVQGNYAYVAIWSANGLTQGVQIIDVSDPADPYLAGRFRTPCIAYGIAVSENNIYLADNLSFMILHSNLTDIADEEEIPSSFSIWQNYPNPFNAQTTIRYSLPKAMGVSIDIYDILGRKIGTLASGMQSAGEHKVVWDAQDVPSGVYFAQIESNGEKKNIKMIFQK
jgi:hypothetical protein